MCPTNIAERRHQTTLAVDRSLSRPFFQQRDVRVRIPLLVVFFLNTFASHRELVKPDGSIGREEVAS